jgi:hypothetical protein
MNIFIPPASAPNVAKISQFSKGMGKIWDVWCKGAQCSMMSDWKTYYNFQLKIFDCYIFAFGIHRNFVKP